MDTAGKMMSERLSTCEAILSKRGTCFRWTMIWSWWRFQRLFKAQLCGTVIRSWYDKASNEKSLRRNSPLPQLLSIPSFCAEWSGSSVTLETTYIQKQHGCYKITPSFDLFLCARLWLCACVFLALCALWLTLWSPPWEPNWFLFIVTKHAHIDPSSIRPNLPLSTVELPWRDWRESGRPRPRSSFTWPCEENGIRKYFILSLGAHSKTT